MHLFPTGQGNSVGHPVEPVIKLTGNPKTAASMTHIGFDVSKLLRREMTLLEAGDHLMEGLTRTVNGRLTCGESLGHRVFVSRDCIKAHDDAAGEAAECHARFRSARHRVGWTMRLA